MKSIFVLNKYGITMTILRKLYDLDITYIDLEFFGTEILKENSIRNQQADEILEAFEKSKNDKEKNISLELQFYDLSRNYTNIISEKNISLYDIENLDVESFCKKYDVKPKMYNDVSIAFEKFKLDNRHLKTKTDYSKYLLEIIRKEATLKKVDIAKIINILFTTTYPINFLNNDLEILNSKNLITIDNDKVSYKLSSILDEIKKLDDKKQDIITERLNGKTLQEIADKHTITRERVRQIIMNIYSKIDIVEEEKYKNIYEKYELSLEQFTTIFEEPISTYYYLFDKYKKGTLEFTDLEKEYYADEEMQKRIRLLKNEIYINNTYINGDRDGVTKYCLQHLCSGEVNIPDFYNIVNSFINNELKEYNIDDYETEHNLEALLMRKNWCVFGKNKKIRYYEMDLLSEADMLKLKEILDVEYGLYSSLYFYENNIDLMEELDIRNEQELHNILRNSINVDSVIYLRMPNILIGYENKEQFFKDKFTELSPISITEFLNIMRTNYGHREDTLLSYLCLEFKEYMTGENIVSNVVDIPFSSLQYLVSKLTKLVYSVNEFKEILKESNLEDPNQLLNNINLKKLNYKIMGSYVVKDSFNTMEEAIYSAIYKGDITHSFLAVNSTSYAIIGKLEKELKVIEIDKKFHALEKIYNLGITKEDILDFMDVIKKEFSRENYYFTAKIVRSKISHKLLDNNMLNDSFIDSIIKLVDGFKRIIWHDNTIFGYSPETSISRKSFLYDVIKNNNGISLIDLQNKLLNEYGIKVNQEQIKYIGYEIDIEMENDIFCIKSVY